MCPRSLECPHAEERLPVPSVARRAGRDGIEKADLAAPALSTLGLEEDRRKETEIISSGETRRSGQHRTWGRV